MLLDLQIDDLIDRALAEDLGLGDVTTGALLPAGLEGRAAVFAKEPAVLAGVEVFRRVFERLGGGVEVVAESRDGERVAVGDRVLSLQGSVAEILMGERVALNLLQRASGVATLTARYVDALPSGSTTVIVDTRKTTPGLRALERYAVRCGGGSNHRPRLDGGVLIKENHIAACGSAGEAVRRARARLGPALRVEVEVSRLDQLEEVVQAGAEVVMLDNMDDDQVREALRRLGGRVLVEVSGGVTIDRIPTLARAGVDFVSVGALTHSAPAIDLSLLLEPC